MPWLTGYPRKDVPWHPTIDAKKCVGCGMCMNCGKNVYDWIEGKAVVARPYDCVVGCSTCAALCQGKAISFPEVGPVRAIYAKEKIWEKVKATLIEEGKIPHEDKLN